MFFLKFVEKVTEEIPIGTVFCLDFRDFPTKFYDFRKKVFFESEKCFITAIWPSLDVKKRLIFVTFLYYFSEK